ncbi:MAG: hypothetical protein ACXVKA_14740 [Acidimicrobiia bacterium]
MIEDVEPPPAIGWLRAVLIVAAITLVGIGILVYGTNAVLTMHGKTRSSLVAVATTIFFVGLLALAWVLRVLQRRKTI